MHNLQKTRKRENDILKAFAVLGLFFRSEPGLVELVQCCGCSFELRLDECLLISLGVLRFMDLGYRMVFELRAFASMRAVKLFLRARAVINFLMRAMSTLENTNGEQRALRKFSVSWNLSLFKRCFAPSNLANTLKTGQQAKARQHDKA